METDEAPPATNGLLGREMETQWVGTSKQFPRPLGGQVLKRRHVSRSSDRVGVAPFLRGATPWILYTLGPLHVGCALMPRRSASWSRRRREGDGASR